MRKTTLAWTFVILGMASVLLPSSARAGARYYTIVFGSQSTPKLLRYCHTWATFIRVVGEGDDPNGFQVYQHTISWMPASLNVKTFSPVAEKGVNLDLYATLDVVAKHGEGVTIWGPFQIEPEAYERSLRVKESLDSGAIQYRAISSQRDLVMSDCIHAVASVDPIFGRGHYPLIRIGKPASRFMARQVVLRSVYDQYETQAAWLIPWLGLDRYPIEVIPPQQIPRRNCVLCRIPD